ncbi:MAG: M28 family metallopeptidase [Planctomycetota bacterium]|jgi:hypothetical protein
MSTFSLGNRPRQVLITALVLVLGGPVYASDRGKTAAARVREDSYRYFLDDTLYTHPGDNRGSGPEHELARDNIFTILTSYGLDVALEPFEYLEDTYYNVVATKVGTTYPGQDYIIGAHYDSWHNPGAVDNASGVALVLEAARVLSNFESEYTIRFVAFDQEELCWCGSYAYVDTHIDDNILGVINTDMVAYNPQGPLVEDLVCVWGREASDPIKNALEQATPMYSPTLTPLQAGRFDASDHVPFEEAGIQACMFSQCQTGAHWHTPQDSVATPGWVDYTYAIQIARVVVGFLVDHAGVNVPISNGDFDGDEDVDLDDFTVFQGCVTGPDAGPVDVACIPGDLDFDDDIDCRDWERFVELWSEVGDPPPLAECPFMPREAPWPHDTKKNRYISFAPYDNAQEVAFKVELTAGPSAPLIVGWVAEPFDPSCEDEYGTPNGDPCESVDYVARIASEAVYRHWNESVVHVGDCETIPVATYAVWATLDGVVFSPPLELATIKKPGTRYYGDVVGTGTGDLPPLPGFTGPNRAVNVTDVQAFLLTVQGPTSPSVHTTWVDMHGLEEGSPPNFILNVSDLQRILFGIEGFTYTATPGQLNPADCP